MSDFKYFASNNKSGLKVKQPVVLLRGKPVFKNVKKATESFSDNLNGNFTFAVADLPYSNWSFTIWKITEPLLRWFKGEIEYLKPLVIILCNEDMLLTKQDYEKSEKIKKLAEVLVVSPENSNRVDNLKKLSTGNLFYMCKPDDLDAFFISIAKVLSISFMENRNEPYLMRKKLEQGLGIIRNLR